MQVIPSLDLLGGKVVRLHQGRYDAVTEYSDDPAGIARSWAGIAQRLHVVDLEGARAGEAVQSDLVRRVAEAFGAGVQVGGGVRTLAAVESYFALGVERVVLGTAALRDPKLVEQAALAHPGRVVVAVDARAGLVATAGWLEQSERRALELVREMADWPVAAVLYTDIERDGTEVGPNVAETAALAEHGGLPVIASGGVGSLEHLRALAAAHPRISGAIIGRSLHEARFSLAEAIAAASGRAPGESLG